MKRRLMCLGLLLCLLLGMLPLNALAAPESGEPADPTIETLQSLLLGVSLDPNGLETILHWNDAAIVSTLGSKLQWEREVENGTAYSQKLGLKVIPQEGGWVAYDLAAVNKLSLDAFGKEFSASTVCESVEIKDDLFRIKSTEGYYERMYILEYRQIGDLLVAVGRAMAYKENTEEIKGYFLAEFRKNPSGVYGYTLVSIGEISGESEVYGMVATASSELKPDTKKYTPERVNDGDEETSWAEGTESLGVGEWIQLDSSDGKPVTFSTIELLLGYNKSKSSREKNGWPTKLRIEADGWSKDVEFSDYEADVVLDEPLTTAWVRFTILEAKAGSEYDDVCISEIALHGFDCEEAFRTYQYTHMMDPDTPKKIEMLVYDRVSILRQPGFEPGTILEAPVLTGEDEHRALSSFAEGELSSHAVYDLVIYQDEEVYKEEKRILEIRLPIPDPEQTEGWMVYRIGENSHARVEYEYDNGYVVLHTKELGRYIVTRLNKFSKEPAQVEEDQSFWEQITSFVQDNVLILLLVGAAVLVLFIGILLLVLLMSGRRREDDDE